MRTRMNVHDLTVAEPLIRLRDLKEKHLEYHNDESAFVKKLEEEPVEVVKFAYNGNKYNIIFDGHHRALIVWLHPSKFSDQVPVKFIPAPEKHLSKLETIAKKAESGTRDIHYLLNFSNDFHDKIERIVRKAYNESGRDNKGFNEAVDNTITGFYVLNCIGDVLREIKDSKDKV